MTYEICGQRGQYFCEPYARTSADGADWCDPADPGASLHSADGRYFAHTPTVGLAPGGRIVLIGQSHNTQEPDTGTVSGSWILWRR